MTSIILYGIRSPENFALLNIKEKCMHIIGLTGSVASGKSTTSKVLSQMGLPVIDCDQIVHEVQTQNETLNLCLKKMFPTAFDGHILNRRKLSDLVMGDLTLLQKIETVTLPYVHQAINQKLAYYKSLKEPLVVMDVPLLFETHMEGCCDTIICVYVPEDMQKKRFMARAGMNEQKFKTIVQNQMPIEEKLRKSTYKVISDNMDNLISQVQEIVLKVKNP